MCRHLLLPISNIFFLQDYFNKGRNNISCHYMFHKLFILSRSVLLVRFCWIYATQFKQIVYFNDVNQVSSVLFSLR